MSRQLDDRRSTVEVLRDTRRDTAATVEVANETSRSLAQQDEQIDRIDGKLDKVEAELRVSDRILKSMTSFTGMIGSIFGRSSTNSRERPAVAEPVLRPAHSSATSPPAEQRALAAGGAVTAEEDQLLDEIASDLERVRQTAKTQNETLRSQNQRLDKLQHKSEAVNDHMERTRHKVTRML